MKVGLIWVIFWLVNTDTCLKMPIQIMLIYLFFLHWGTPSLSKKSLNVSEWIILFITLCPDLSCYGRFTSFYWDPIGVEIGGGGGGFLRVERNHLFVRFVFPFWVIRSTWQVGFAFQNVFSFVWSRYLPSFVGRRLVAKPLFIKRFFKWANPGLFFIYFRSFHIKNTIFTPNQRMKMSCLSSAGIQTHDLLSMSCLQ